MSCVVERSVHWRVRPRVGDGVGTGMERVRRREPLADQRVKVTEAPAQLRTSVEKREGVEFSYGF